MATSRLAAGEEQGLVRAGGVWMEHEDLEVGRFTYVRVWVEAGREMGDNGGAVWVEADREGGNQLG